MARLEPALTACACSAIALHAIVWEACKVQSQCRGSTYFKILYTYTDPDLEISPILFPDPSQLSQGYIINFEENTF